MEKKKGSYLFVVGILVLLMVFCLAACSANEPVAAPGDNSTGTETAVTQTPVKEEQSKEDTKKDDNKEDKKDKDDKKTSEEEQPESNVQEPSADNKTDDGTGDKKQPAADGYGILNLDGQYTYEAVNTAVKLSFMPDGSFEFDQDNSFFSKDITFTIDAPKGAKVYYTLDGSMPDAESEEYSSAFNFTAKNSDFPDAYILRAKAVLEDGTESKVAAHTYFVGERLDGRFSTLIFSISGDPEEITERPDGILTGNNYKERGRESEREVFVEAWQPDGTSIFSQFAGVRVYGGYSRQYSIKSLKLFARKSYDPDYGTFKIDLFNDHPVDDEEKVIKKYDKLVLRNAANDLQFSYIRDELSQTLARLAGFELFEGVIPAVGYINGEYYGFYWLHENYCDRLLKEKYGDAKGEFVILEGSEKTKNDDADIQDAVDEYNDFYDYIVEQDLTDDAKYDELCKFIDVENYLTYFAWNIALNNFDWPNNNYKCFKYVPDEGESYGEGVFDGRYRFLLHDMDYTYGLYDQNDTQANYNILRTVLNSRNQRFAPLFARLIERKDCREFFKAKTYEFIEGALSPEVMYSVYEELHQSRSRELAYYYDFLKELNRKGDFSIWTDASHYANYEKQIKAFADKRADYVARFMEGILADYED